MMDLVIPTRPSRRNESLRWALRCWAAHVPDVDPLVIGARPAWYRGRFRATTQRPGTAHQWVHNFPRAMRSAVMGLELPFWWTADDIFPLAQHPEMAADPPTWCRMRDLDSYPGRPAAQPGGYRETFVAGMIAQREVLRALSIDTQHNADMHLPHLLDPDCLATLMDTLARDFPTHPVGHFRAIYAGLWPGRVERVTDPKVQGLTLPRPGAGWVSTARSSWDGPAGKAIRAAYPDPSPWERP